LTGSGTDLPLDVDAGGVFDIELQYETDAGQPLSLAGNTAKLQVRPKADSPIVLLELTTENGGITLEPNARTGVIALFAGKSQTAALRRGGVYDLLLIPADPERAARLFGGPLRVTQVVTQ
jgi:hypothetical protein